MRSAPKTPNRPPQRRMAVNTAKPGQSGRRIAMTNTQPRETEQTPARPLTLEQTAEMVRGMCYHHREDGFGPAWFTDDRWRRLIRYCHAVHNAGIEVAPIIDLHLAEFMALRGGGSPSEPELDG